MGSAAQYLFLAQLFLPQTAAPWPSKTPPPDIVRWSTWLKTTQLGSLKALGSAGAFMMPLTWSSIADLQGPSRLARLNLYVPFGITILLGVVDAHASFQAFSKGYVPKTKSQKLKIKIVYHFTIKLSFIYSCILLTVLKSVFSSAFAPYLATTSTTVDWALGIEVVNKSNNIDRTGIFNSTAMLFRVQISILNLIGVMEFCFGSNHLYRVFGRATTTRISTKRILILSVAEMKF